VKKSKSASGFLNFFARRARRQRGDMGALMNGNNNCAIRNLISKMSVSDTVVPFG
jgi:hypothetical protein